MTDKQLGVLLSELSSRIDREIGIVDEKLVDVDRNRESFYIGPDCDGINTASFVERQNPDNYENKDTTAIVLDELRKIVRQLKGKSEILVKS